VFKNEFKCHGNSSIDRSCWCAIRWSNNNGHCLVSPKLASRSDFSYFCCRLVFVCLKIRSNNAAIRVLLIFAIFNLRDRFRTMVNVWGEGFFSSFIFFYFQFKISLINSRRCGWSRNCRSFVSQRSLWRR